MEEHRPGWDKVIRIGHIDDIEKIIEVGTKLLTRSKDRNVPIDRRSVFMVIRNFIQSADKALLVAEHDDVFTGLIMASCEPFWWDNHRSGRRYVTDWAFYSERPGDGLKMLKIITEWAWSMPRVVKVAIARNFDNAEDSADRVFEAAGFERAGAMYTCFKPEVN